MSPKKKSLLALALGLGLTALLLGLVAGPAHAATPIYVRTDGNDANCDGTTNTAYPGGGPQSCAKQTIAAGIAAVDSGGTVIVAAGVYTETVNVTKNVTLQGASSASTIVDGAGGGSVIYVNAYTATISGVTLRNGAATYGGGIYAYNATVTISDVTLLNGSATYGGGLAGRDSVVNLTNATIVSNTAADWGGGVYNYNGAMALGGATIANNRVITNYDGGGIYNSVGSKMTLVNTAVLTNTAKRWGGGIANYGAITLTGGSVASNTAAFGGGGIINGGDGAVARLTGVTVRGNQVTGATEFGGGIYNYGGSALLALSNSLVVENSAHYGGGIVNSGSDRTTISLNQTSVESNTATAGGGGIYNENPCVAVVVGGSVSHNDGGGNVAGGIWNRGALTLTSVTVGGNRTNSGGGGLYNGYSGGAARAFISATTIISNTANGSGGGLYNYNDCKVTLAGSIVSRNFASDASSYGGGIWNSGALTLTDTSVSQNQAAAGGGGIFNQSASPLLLFNTAVLTNVADADNLSGGDGGGIHHTGLTLIISGSLFAGNVARYGGGIYATGDGPLLLTNSTVRSNHALTAPTALSVGGGGIFNNCNATLANVTVNGNESQDHGGGIHNQSRITMTNVTVSGNTAPSGGGLFNTNPPYTATLVHCTIASNTSTFPAEAGVVNYGDLILRNTIVANGSYANCKNNHILLSADYNLDSDGSCGLTDTHDISGVNPLLGPLADNGGGTWTHALPSTSPAVDAIPAGSCAAAADQRGVPRPQDGDGDWVARCDVGAFEFQRRYVYLPVVLRN